jgi:hypothetical protein
MFQTEIVVGKIKTHSVFSDFVFLNIVLYIWNNVQKYGENLTGFRRRRNMARVHWVLDNLWYRHTLRMCNTAFPQQQWLHEHASTLRHTQCSPKVLGLIILKIEDT